ncbi:MAG TPA: sulfite exporter TauE/SafE family protein, partial [Candidatus Poseidoniales archaeon]
MVEVIIVAAGAFIAAALTVPAGFGLSTMLTPFV